MPMYNLLEYSQNYAKASASVWEYCRDKADDSITSSKSFKFKSSITNDTNNAGIAEVKIIVPLRHLSNFWETLEIPLINCRVTLLLNRAICEVNRVVTFAMTSANFTF